MSDNFPGLSKVWATFGLDDDSGYFSLPIHLLTKERTTLASNDLSHESIQNVKDERWSPPGSGHIPPHIWAQGEEMESFVCQHCHQLFSRAEFPLHVLCEKSVRKLWNCWRCGEGFLDSGDFRRHLQVHYRVDNPYVCPQCDKSFRLKKQLARHQKWHTMSFQCPRERGKRLSLRTFLCQRRSRLLRFFKCKGVEDEDWYPLNIPEHIQAIGEGLQVFSCQKCHQKFKRAKFTLHCFCKNGVCEPWNCTRCRKGFLRWTDFERHMRGHYRVYNPYVCPQCDKSFRLKNQLRRHKKSHIMSCKCPWKCGKSVSSKTVLCKHFKWQRSLNMCDRCGEVCLTLETWRRHREHCRKDERSAGERLSQHPVLANQLTTTHNNHVYENRPLFMLSTQVSMNDPPEMVHTVSVSPDIVSMPQPEQETVPAVNSTYYENRDFFDYLTEDSMTDPPDHFLSLEMEMDSNHATNTEEYHVGPEVLHEDSYATGESYVPPDIISISQPEQETAPAVTITTITEPSPEVILFTIEQKEPLPAVSQKCGESYESPKKLRKPMNKVHNNLPFTCLKFPVKCGKAYQLGLQTRIPTVETVPFICDRCDKHFATESGLQKHVQLKHTNMES